SASTTGCPGTCWRGPTACRRARRCAPVPALAPRPPEWCAPRRSAAAAGVAAASPPCPRPRSSPPAASSAPGRRRPGERTTIEVVESGGPGNPGQSRPGLGGRRRTGEGGDHPGEERPRLGGLLHSEPAVGELEHRLLHHVARGVTLEDGLQQFRRLGRL